MSLIFQATYIENLIYNKMGGGERKKKDRVRKISKRIVKILLVIIEHRSSIPLEYLTFKYLGSIHPCTIN